MSSNEQYSGNALLELRDVHVAYPARRRGGSVARAVDGVQLILQPGEIVALVGESGCGKTTLARAILGLQQLSQGTIQFDGESIPTDAAGKKLFRRQVQIVFQDPTASLNPRQSVYEIVAEGLRIHGNSENEHKIVSAALERCGLHPADRYLLRYPHELSGGQRQRVVIAGAMVLEPRLLIADEPVSSLDASVRGEILKLLRDLARDKNMAVLVVTHDLGLPWNIADRIAVMYLGRIVEIGITEDVLARPKHPYTRALLSVVHEHLQLEQQILKGDTPDPTSIARGCRFNPRCPMVQSGEAERLGILQKCLNDDPVLPNKQNNDHVAACHALNF